MGEYDEISKNKEEQEERLEAIKYKNKDLEDCIKQCDNEIDKQSADIQKIKDMITDTANKKSDKEKIKRDLEAETAQLHVDITKQREIVLEKKEEYLKIKEQNKQKKMEIDNKENQI